jgi:broad specificity phosphatase PhoE
MKRPERSASSLPVSTTFFFVRHGESEANLARVFSGRRDSPLTERGRAQAVTVADALADVPFDRIVATPLSRSLDTALVVARRRKMPVDVVRDLIEIDVGEKTGATFDEVAGLPDWKDDGFISWPSGETLHQVLARSLKALTRIHRESGGETVLVIGHGGVTRILVSHFLGILPKLDASRQTNTAVTVIVTDGDTGRVERLFESAHVADLPPRTK